MPGLNILIRLVKVLHSDTSPSQIAGGFILGMIIGLSPTMNLHNLLVVLFLCILNVNIAAGILGYIVFSGVAFLMDSYFHSIGYYLLMELPDLKSVWVSMYNTPIIALTNFNNTVVIGSFVSALCLITPVFFLVRYLIDKYRVYIAERMEKWKIVKLIKGSKLYEIYQKVGG